MLDVGDGHALYWEERGSPGGTPAVVLHGGPGSGCTSWMARMFDPAAYRIVLFDQRGCGRSTPHAGGPVADLSANTTHHLVADVERLRRHVGAERFVVLGFSWGCTLGLAHAQRHPDRVAAMVLVGVTTTRRSEVDWLYRGLAPLFPEQWERFRAGAPAGTRDEDLVEAYARLLADPDPAVSGPAARAWVEWEWSLDVDAAGPPTGAWAEPAFQLAFARLVTHYFRHGAWLEEGELLRAAGRLAGVPGVLVNGRLDLQAPLVTAWELHRAWPGSALVVVPGAGHSAGSGDGLAAAAAAALDRFAGAR